MQIILHIGHSKTASTSIQFYADRNRAALASEGVLYPTAFGLKKSFLHRKAARRGRVGTREAAIPRLAEEFSGDHARAVVSDETLYRCWGWDKRAIRRLLEPYAESWRILLYVRRPDEHIVSHYQQNIRNPHGFHGSFDTFFHRMMINTYYRFALQVRRWEDVFGQGSVAVRVFHRATLQGGPVEDFLRWIDLDPARLPADDQEPANISLDRAGIEILRFIYEGGAGDPGLPRGQRLRDVRGHLRALASDDMLRLDGYRARQLHEQFRRDHELLAERHLPPAHAAALLAPPADSPVQPPVSADLLLERMRTLFSDPDLARLAVERIAARTKAEAQAAGRRSVVIWPLARVVGAIYDGYSRWR